ncbi:hypothetical protein ABZ942_31525 [Nocardia sp. NPDC046473]|uniref:hypothetical protein n=1 Tax=Nocardia sp. NPDC046473 TaxID=3155733 RepID=UPI0033FFC090
MTESERTCWQTIAGSGVIERLDQVGSLVALERIPHAAGATNWYTAESRADLVKIVHALGPGSLVSFYFDNRISRAPYAEKVRTELLEFITRDRDALIGWPAPDGIRIDMAVVGGPRDIDEEVSDSESDEDVFYGAYPGWDNDGVEAITVTLPDADGVTRQHPY